MPNILFYLNTGLGNIGKAVNNKWIGGMVAGEHISSDGVLLENNAFYISTVSIIGTANKDGGTYVAPIASIGSFVFIGGDAAISKKYIASQNVGVAVHAIFKTGSSGNQKLAIYTNSENYIPDLVFRVGAIRIL